MLLTRSIMILGLVLLCGGCQTCGAYTRVTSPDALVRLRPDKVERLHLQGPNIDNRTLGHLQRFPRLTRLWLDNTQVDDEGLAHLVELRGLLALHLMGADISDDGLLHLGKLEALEGLHLDRTPITDEGVSHLRGLSELRSLGLAHTRITTDSLEHLRDIMDPHGGVTIEGTPITVEQLHEAIGYPPPQQDHPILQDYPGMRDEE